MRIFIALLPAMLAVSIACPSCLAGPLNTGHNIRLSASMRSMHELQYQSVVRQSRDYSCGSAALATLLNFYHGLEIAEENILAMVFASLPEEKIMIRKKDGISLLDLQRICATLDIKGDGFRLKPEDLAKLDRPVIVFIEHREYKHFAILKGIRNGRVYLADPALGNIRIPLFKFRERWINKNGQGVVFATEKTDQPNATALNVPATILSQPELLSVRELLNQGNPYIQNPDLFRTGVSRFRDF